MVIGDYVTQIIPYKAWSRPLRHLKDIQRKDILPIITKLQNFKSTKKI